MMKKNTIIKLNVYSIVLYFSNRDLSMYWIAKRRVNIIVQTVWTNIIHWKSRIRWSLSQFITKTFITWIVQSLIWMILFSEYFRLITKVRVFINIHWLQCASVLSSDSLRIYIIFSVNVFMFFTFQFMSKAKIYRRNDISIRWLPT